MADRILIFYGSYRSDRQGIRLADFLVRSFRERGAEPELIDAKAVGLPIFWSGPFANAAPSPS